MPFTAKVLLVMAAAAPLAVRAAACVEPPPDPGNTYDAERSHAELVRHYPFIRIASAAVPDGVRVVRDQTYVRYGSRCLQLDLYLPANAPRQGAPACSAPPIRSTDGCQASVLAQDLLSVDGDPGPRRRPPACGARNQ